MERALDNDDDAYIKRYLEKENPKFTITDDDDDEVDLFYYACCKGSTKVITVLLEDGRINFNKKYQKSTGFSEACQNGHVNIVKILLDDSRIDVDGSHWYDEESIPYCM